MYIPQSSLKQDCYQTLTWLENWFLFYELVGFDLSKVKYKAQMIYLFKNMGMYKHSELFGSRKAQEFLIG